MASKGEQGVWLPTSSSPSALCCWPVPEMEVEAGESPLRDAGAQRHRCPGGLKHGGVAPGAVVAQGDPRRRAGGSPEKVGEILQEEEKEGVTDGMVHVPRFCPDSVILPGTWSG